jgi:hypothetical protein
MPALQNIFAKCVKIIFERYYAFFETSLEKGGAEVQ